MKFKKSLRNKLQRTAAGSAIYFGYGNLRSLPHRVARSATRFGYDTCERLGLEPEWEAPLDYQWRSILRRSRGYLPLPANSGGRRVLFATSYGFNAFVTGLHSMLAVALQLRGARCEFLVCDKALPACDWNQYGNMEPDPGKFGPRLPRLLGLSRCRRCTANLDAVYHLLGLPIRRMRPFTSRSDLSALVRIVDGKTVGELQKLVYRDVLIGEHGYATTVRLLMRGTLEEGNANHVWLLRREVLGAAVAADLLSALLDEYSPDCIVMQHGIYVTHGVLSDLARLKGIRVAVHEWSDRKNTFIWSHGQTTHRELLEEPNSAWESLELGIEQNRRLDEYLDSKRYSGMDWLTHYPNPEEDWAAITHECGLSPQDKFVALFTNTMWDAQVHYESSAFPGMLDWILFTLDYARRRPDLKFVIREHPGEARVWGRPGQRIFQEIKQCVPTMPSNVVWILAESNVSSYTLASVAQASVVYGTKLGLELAVRGLPVLIVGNAFVRGKGITYDVGSPTEYERLLGQVPGLPRYQSEQIARARRYAYHYFFHRVVEIPLLTMENPAKGTKATLRFRQIGELRPGQDKVLDQICQGILDERPFAFA